LVGLIQFAQSANQIESKSINSTNQINLKYEAKEIKDQLCKLFYFYLFVHFVISYMTDYEPDMVLFDQL